MGSVLCNACGLFLKLHGRPRPISLKTDVIKSRNRVKTSSGGPKKRVCYSSCSVRPLCIALTMVRRLHSKPLPMASQHHTQTLQALEATASSRAHPTARHHHCRAQTPQVSRYTTPTSHHNTSSTTSQSTRFNRRRSRRLPSATRPHQPRR